MDSNYNTGDVIKAKSFNDQLSSFLVQLSSYTNGKEIPERHPSTGVQSYNKEDLSSVVLSIEIDPENNKPIAPNTEVQLSTVIDDIMKVVDAFRSVHYVNSYWYHGYQGWSILKSSTSGYLVTNDVVPKREQGDSGSISNNAAHAQILVPPTSPQVGDPITRTNISSMMTTLFNKWKAGITTITYTYWTCHFNCHWNYNNRVRR